jgi:ComF family protein
MFARLLAQVLSFVFPPRADEKIVLELAPDTLLAHLDPELVPLGSGFGAATLLPFTDERVRGALHEAKYQGNARAFALLAAVLSEYLREAMNERFERGSYVLVPVPLGAARRKERGFNQVEEVLKRVAKGLQLSLDSSLLVRTRETSSQVSLPRAKRLENMKNAFACPSKLEERSRDTIYIVVDDVLTTGATLSAACSALHAAGASHVLAIALAH